MIYLDNSATTHHKPPTVISAVSDMLKHYSANPGRSGHRLSMISAQKVFECRQALSQLFNISDESKVIFTSGCTQSLNMVIKGLLKPGDHCIISDLEHNSVVRPIVKLSQYGVSYSTAKTYADDDDKTVESFRELINDKTKLIVCTHASNVFGFRLPVERICKLAHKYGVLFCLDSAQSAGVLPINISESDFDYVCCAGHKGLYGPMGVGVLIINSDILPDTLIEGGTGSESDNLNQPLFLPDRYESGTLNVPGICGLCSGVNFILNKTVDAINTKEINLIKKLHSALKNNDRVTLYSDINTCARSAPVLSFSVENMNSEAVSKYLSDKFNIATRAGLHCSYLAHKKMGTLSSGTVRISPSYFTTENDINRLIYAINKLN